MGSVLIVPLFKKADSCKLLTVEMSCSLHTLLGVTRSVKKGPEADRLDFDNV